MSLAFAIAEKMLKSKAFTLFVTHYPQITSIANMHTNARNVHFRTTFNNTTSSINHLHQLSNGPCDLSTGYGIMAAEVCGFDSTIVQDARRLRKVVRDSYPQLLPTTIMLVDTNGAGLTTTTVASLTILVRGLLLLQHSTLDRQGLREYLQSLRRRVDDASMQSIRQYLASITRTRVNPITDAATTTSTNCNNPNDNAINTKTNISHKKQSFGQNQSFDTINSTTTSLNLTDVLVVESTDISTEKAVQQDDSAEYVSNPPKKRKS